ncbi:hypothetical protein CR513_44196, partial [Mucuna pruriens]
MILRRTSDPSMSLYLTMCKRKRGCRDIRLKGCLWCQSPSNDERFIFVGYDNKVVAKVIGTFILQLKIGFHLNLFKTFIVSSFRQNLISISNLDKFGFSCSFENNKVSLY